MDTPPPLDQQPAVPAVGSNDKILAVLCHASPLFALAFILPLIVYLLKKDESDFVKEQSREALNFHITAFLAGLLASLLIFAFIGAVLLPLIGIAVVVLAIVATIKVLDGKPYLYPCILRLVK